MLQDGFDIIDITIEVEEYQPPFHEEENLPEDFDSRRIRPYNSPYIQNGVNENGANLIPRTLSDFDLLPGFQRVFQRDYSPVPDEDSESRVFIDRHQNVQPTREDRRTPVVLPIENFIGAETVVVDRNRPIRGTADDTNSDDFPYIPFLGVDQPRGEQYHGVGEFPPSYNDAVASNSEIYDLRNVPMPSADRWDNIVDRARMNIENSEIDIDEIVIPRNEELDNQIIRRAETVLFENRHQRIRDESFWSRMVVCR